MAEFVWKAARRNAEMVEGRTQADNQAQVTLQLRAQGLTPLFIVVGESGSVTTAQSVQKAQIKQDLHSGGFFASKAITQADVLVLTSELSIMLNAGLALDSALRVLIGMSAKPAMVVLVQFILDDVKSGVPLSRVLARHPEQFSDFYVNMVRSGEASGQLSAVLDRLNEHLERLSSLRESVISASMYPLILLGVAILSLVAMIGFVVPQFETLFKGMGDALPAPTRIVMNIGTIFTNYGPAIGLGLAVVVLLLRQWLNSPSGRKWWQARALGIPIAGKLLLKYDLTLYARSLGTLLGNGVPLLQALHIATQTVGNINLRNALATVAPHVKGGGKMVDALKSSGIFEPLALSLVKVGEETGRVGTMLLELARIYNRDVENGIKRGLTLLEPVLILVLGLIIASIIVSILLGILSINDLVV